jgi:hypothetical protein
MRESRVFDFNSDPSHDVICLETNRRVTAVLHCGDPSQLLLLNGGSEIEQLHADVVVPAIREPLCLGSHSVEPGKFVVVDVARPSRSVPLCVRIVGGPKPMTLKERPAPLRISVARLATAAALVAGFGTLLTLQNGPHPNAPHRIAVPRVAAKPHAHHRVALRPPPKTVAVPAPRIAVAPPPPTILVSTPAHVYRGQPIDVAFRTSGEQVRIVAQIGPRKIADRIIGASYGKLMVRPPPSSDIRVLTIEAQAQKDAQTSSRMVIVILLPDAAPRPIPPVTNL